MGMPTNFAGTGAVSVPLQASNAYILVMAVHARTRTNRQRLHQTLPTLHGGHIKANTDDRGNKSINQ